MTVQRPLMVALDLDGTTIAPFHDPTPAVVAAVGSAIAAGCLVTIVTGRMGVAARPIARILGITGPIVCYQGAAIFDASSGELLQETPLPNAVAMRVYERSKRDGYHMQMYADDRFYCEHANKYSDLYARISGSAPIVVESLPQTFAGRDSTKVNIITEPERAAAYFPVMAELCGNDAYVTRSNPEFVEIINREVDKGRSLAWIAERAGIPMERVMAIGDSYNDIPMLEAVGFGVAMGSSPADLIAVAKAVVGDVAHDGVAEALERFVLGESAA